MNVPIHPLRFLSLPIFHVTKRGLRKQSVLDNKLAPGLHHATIQYCPDKHVSLAMGRSIIPSITYLFHTNILAQGTYYLLLVNLGDLGAFSAFRWDRRTSKQKQHISGQTVTSYPFITTPFSCAIVIDLQDRVRLRF